VTHSGGTSTTTIGRYDSSDADFAGCVRVPPAGFEPALTAPEGDAVHRPDLALCAERGAVGRVWGARNVGLSESHERERTALTHEVAVAIGAYRAVHKL